MIEPTALMDQQQLAGYLQYVDEIRRPAPALVMEDEEMLALARSPGESIQIGNHATAKVVSVQPEKCVLEICWDGDTRRFVRGLDQLVTNGHIVIRVLRFRGERVVLGITAPGMVILRSELAVALGPVLSHAGATVALVNGPGGNSERLVEDIGSAVATHRERE